MALNIYLLLGFLLWPVVLWLAWRGEHSYRGLPQLRLKQVENNLPPLSIIVPARNEAQNLPRLLASLLSQEYPGPVEVIVVDDNSSDATAQVATALGANVIRLNRLPEGWLGKPHACQRGAESASGDWFLFTDADTCHQPASAASAVHYALQSGLDCLSAFLKQEPTGRVEALVLACGFAGLFARPGQVRGIFNGQYILVSREVFRASGGFEAVRMSPLEDIAFGNRLLELGYQARLLRGEALAGVRMYTGPAHLWQGMTRLGAGSLAHAEPAALLTVIFIAQMVTPLIYLALALSGCVPLASVPVVWLLAALMVLPWARRFGSVGLALFAPIGGLFIALAAMWGLLGHLTGSGYLWKGRRV